MFSTLRCTSKHKLCKVLIEHNNITGLRKSYHLYHVLSVFYIDVVFHRLTKVFATTILTLELSNAFLNMKKRKQISSRKKKREKETNKMNLANINKAESRAISKKEKVKAKNNQRGKKKKKQRSEEEEGG